MLTYWSCALYCRLSVEDSNNRESNSIQSQKIILSNFVDELPSAVIEKIYVDDGFSGSNFDRPEFKNMIKDIEECKINCVVVKDYSRFGRDYIDVGYYVEKYFTEKNIRFISVNDNHDSLTEESHNDFKMPIMNMFNDIQSRETSKKVRSGLKARKQQGKYIGAFAPYGYLKSPEDRNKLIIDENVSHIIKQIFSWRVEGYSTYAINTRLNEMKVPTPTTYKNSIGINHNPVNVKSNKVSFWNETTVRKILSNEAYIGNIVQNKRTTKNHRTKQIIDLDESNWIRVENIHEPIIDIEIWDKAQSMVKKRTRVSPNSRKLNLFSGIIKCADCGHTMVRRKNGNGSISYTCTTHRSDKSKCSTHTISERVLKESVLAIIMFQVKLYVDVDLLVEEIKNSEKWNSKEDLINKTINNLEKNVAIRTKVLKDLYIDLKKDLITEEQYIQIKKETTEELNRLKVQLEITVNDKSKIENSKELNLKRVINKINSVKELTRSIVCELIDYIYIYEDRSIKIDFKFVDAIDEGQI